MANPDVDRLVVGQEAQSESENALMPEVLVPDEKKSPLPDSFANYVEFVEGENSKKQEANVNVEVNTKECVDHLMVEEDVDPPPEPTEDEATMIRRATRKRNREEGEVFHDPFTVWMDDCQRKDTEVNGGIYGFSEDSEADPLYDREMLGVSVDTLVVISDDDDDVDSDADPDYMEFLQRLEKLKKENKGNVEPDYEKWLKMILKKKSK